MSETIRGGLDEVGGEFTCPNDSKKRFLVYGLFDPRDGELRYIGKSCTGMKRPASHTKKADLKRHGKTHKTAWIKSLLKIGMKPTFGVLFESETPDNIYFHEQRLIREFRTNGARLTNATDGGPGRFGYHLSDSTKAKLRRAAKRQQRRSPTKHSSETKEMLRKLQLGRVHTAETRKNMSAAHGGRPFVEIHSGALFNSQMEAVNFFGLKPSTQCKIGMVLNGKKPQYKGMVFRYVKS